MWKAPLIHNLFDVHTAQLILDTLLQQLVTEDKMIWKGEKSGKYSVKSVYRICVTEIADNSRMHVHGWWNLIWKLKVPPKIKNFLWRVCHGCYPKRARLSSRGVSCPLDCVINAITIMKIASIFLSSAIKLFRYGGMWIYGTKLTGCCVKTIIFMLSYSLFCKNFLQGNVNLWPQLCGVFGRAGT